MQETIRVPFQAPFSHKLSFVPANINQIRWAKNNAIVSSELVDVKIGVLTFDASFAGQDVVVDYVSHREIRLNQKHEAPEPKNYTYTVAENSVLIEHAQENARTAEGRGVVKQFGLLPINTLNITEGATVFYNHSSPVDEVLSVVRIEDIVLVRREKGA